MRFYSSRFLFPERIRVITCGIPWNGKRGLSPIPHAAGAVGPNAAQIAGGGIGGFAAGAVAGRSMRSGIAGAVGGGIAGLDGGGLFGGFIGGAYDGFLGPQAKHVNPNGFNAVAGPVIRGIKGGLVSSAVSVTTSWLIDKANSKFGDCGCGEK